MGSWKRLQLSVLSEQLVPQIAGISRGSYFSMTGLLIPKSLNGRDGAAALSPKFVPLHDLHSGLLLAAAATLSPSLFPFMISLPEESMVIDRTLANSQ